jgi:four helix bundle protein
MGKYQKFEDLPVWQEAAQLYNVVHDLLEQRDLPLSASFRNQLDRAAISISNNIVEGFERYGLDEQLSAIRSARGSAGEVRSMLSAIKDRPKLTRYSGEMQRIVALAESCGRQLGGWARAVDKPAGDGRQSNESERVRRDPALRPKS